MLMNRKNKVKLTAEVFSLYLLLPPMKANKNSVEKISITALKNVTCIYLFINRQNLFFLLSLLSILSYFPKNCRQYRAISCFFYNKPGQRFIYDNGFVRLPREEIGKVENSAKGVPSVYFMLPC